MRRALAVLMVVALAPACADDASSIARTRQPLEVWNGSTSNRRLGTSLAGCGSALFFGALGMPNVSRSTGQVPTLPPGMGFGTAVACDDDGAVLAASAPTSQFVWVSAASGDGGLDQMVLDASALTNPGRSLAVHNTVTGVLVAAGAPTHCLMASCPGGLQVWRFEPKMARYFTLYEMPGMDDEALGGSLAFGRLPDGGQVIAVTALGAQGLATFELESNQLFRSDGGPGGLTSVAFGTFPTVGSTFVVGQPGTSSALILDPAGAQPYTSIRGNLRCAADAGLGAVVTAFDWDSDGWSDVVMSNPATNRVEVALSGRNYGCLTLPMPALAGSRTPVAFGQSLASSVQRGRTVLAVGAPTTSDMVLPMTGLVVIYDLCDLPGACDGGVADAGAGDAGGVVPARDGGPDAGNDGGVVPPDVDAGADAGSEVDAGADAGVVVDAGVMDAGPMMVDAGLTDGGAPVDPGAGVLTFIPTSCGCSSVEPAALSWVVALALRRRRR
jgi:hypothetical protein